MLSQIKADYYKLTRSKLLWLCLVLYGALFFLYIIIYFCIGHDEMMYMGMTGTSTQRKQIGQSAIFMVGGFADQSHPQFWEIARSTMSSNFLVWINIIVFSVLFVAKEYDTGTIKLSVAYGTSKFKIYLSKLLISFLNLAVFYYSFMFLAFVFTVFQSHYSPSIENWMQMLQLISVNFAVLAVFMLSCFTISLLVRNTGAASALLCLFLFVEIIALAVLCPYLSTCATAIQLFVKISPMYYLMDVSGYYLTHGIFQEALWYCAVGIMILLPVSWLILRRQEIK